MPEEILDITEMPAWAVWAFVGALVVAANFVVRWVLKHPEPE
ncbi:MAG TPA: hypothetical protein VFA34_01630 [Actinomycetota bacterium]|nr:hypothetical protein [Actinomycetota bacterium]